MQQIELGVLMAARALLPHSNLIGNLVFKPTSKDEGVSNPWLLEELFAAALKSAPIKSIYDRNEVEVNACVKTLLVAFSCLFVFHVVVEKVSVLQSKL